MTEPFLRVHLPEAWRLIQGAWYGDGTQSSCLFQRFPGVSNDEPGAEVCSQGLLLPSLLGPAGFCLHLGPFSPSQQSQAMWQPKQASAGPCRQAGPERSPLGHPASLSVPLP